MNNKLMKIIALILVVAINVNIFITSNIIAGTYADTTGTTDPIGTPVVDTTGSVSIDKVGDKIIEYGQKGLEIPEGAPLGKTPLGAIGSAGKIIKYGGVLVGAYDATKDLIGWFTYKSPHRNTHEKLIDNGLYILNTGMSIAGTVGTIFVLFNPVTVGATGVVATAALVAAPSFAIATGIVGTARGVYNSEVFADAVDLIKGKKKFVFAPFERPNIKEGRQIIKEELGFDPYDWSEHEIPDPSTGIPVYKPNIYIYSSEDMNVNVKLYPYQYITESIPQYDNETGWNAKIVNGSINGKNDYLFYEAIVPDEGIQKESGWVVRQSNLNRDMLKILEQYAFNQKEKKDFVDYWGNKLSGNQDYIFYPQLNTAVDNIMPLDIQPKPQNMFRLWFYIVEKDNQQIMKPDVIKIERSNYTVVEWGGMMGK